MEKTQFTEQELEYINADPFDKSQPIYAYATSREGKILPTRYNIKCINLPKGSYDAGLKVSYHFNTIYAIAYGDLYDKLERYSELGHLSFNIVNNCEIMLKTKLCKRQTVEEIVRSLRTQAVMNARNLSNQQESLIKKDIKNHTDLGEDYNRESFLRTIYECLENDETLEVDFTKSPTDKDVNILQVAKLGQDKNRLLAKRNEIDNEIAEIEKRRQEIINNR